MLTQTQHTPATDAPPLPGSEPELRLLLPEMQDAPAHIPPAIFKTAKRMYVSLQRIDMVVLAEQSGTSRRTLYRRVKGREPLLGELMWFFSRRTMAQALAMSSKLRGADRIVAVYAHILREIYGSEHLYATISQEPDACMRVILSRDGIVHPRYIEFLRALLQLETARGHLDSSIPLEVLAFAITRIGESFLYSQVLTGEPAKPEFSVEMISRLLRPDQVRPARR